MKISRKKIYIKLVITGETIELECASLSRITITNVIDVLYEQNILSEELAKSTIDLCIECPIMSCRAHKMYMGINKSGSVIENPNISLFEAGFREGDYIRIAPHAPCRYFYRKHVLFTSENTGIFKFKIKNIDGKYFYWAVHIGDKHYKIKELFEDLISDKILASNSDIKKYYGNSYSKYGILLSNGTSFSQDSNLTFQELEFMSGDEIWLGIIPSIYVPKDVNDVVPGIVVKS